MITVTKDDLLKSGAHFGHITSKTNPNFRDYVLSQKNGIDIINPVSYTHLRAHET